MLEAVSLPAQKKLEIPDASRDLQSVFEGTLMDVDSDAEGPLTREEFAGFLDRLADTVVEDPGAWANQSIEQFLRAWSAWTIDMDGYFVNRGEAGRSEPSWQLMAQMLLAARIYE